jgi:hypothetical protein
MLLSRTSLEPGIFGIFRPVLVWPQGISERLEDAHLEAVLAHELWHVRRRDNLADAVHMLVEAIFWFYPLVWWMGAWLMEERERACDEAVLESGGDPKVYAESILKICEFCVASPLACVSGVTGADLKKGEPELAAQVPSLPISDRCRCGDESCATFYTQPKPEGAYGPGHRNVVLAPDDGTIILDVVEERIACVEVLDRNDVREKLLEVLP